MVTPNEDITIDVTANTQPFTAKLTELSRQASVFSTTITGAFRAAIAGGRDFESVLRALALRLATIAFDRALQPLSNIIGGAIGGVFAGTGLARGGIIAGGALKPFARGGVTAGPTLFPLRGGLGLAGEAGAEAVLPLARGSDGRLGVASTDGQRPIAVTVNVTTPDAQSFAKAETQVTAMLARAVGRGRRGL
ncbi:phage tail tape measure protein [Bauldia sp.]|uniref:phage tail tape measure protein n=1 Tax=Bauldia sp. TaxID=2575872 RepID=UPI003BAA061B